MYSSDTDDYGDDIGDGRTNNNITLIDGEGERIEVEGEEGEEVKYKTIPFENPTRIDGMTINYTRNFNNTYWQALYIPFSISYEDWKDDFQMAELRNIHQYDDNGDGRVDRTVLEILLVKHGSTKPNCPYLIRAKNPGEKTITVNDAMLYPSEENSIDCFSVKFKYTFTGTYHTIYGRNLVNSNIYFIEEGKMKQIFFLNTIVPFHWYMECENRSSNNHGDSRAMVINIKVIGEDDDTEATGVTEKASDHNRSTEYYHLNGTRVTNPTSSGVLIMKDSNGRTKKIIKTRR